MSVLTSINFSEVLYFYGVVSEHWSLTQEMYIRPSVLFVLFAAFFSFGLIFFF